MGFGGISRLRLMKRRTVTRPRALWARVGKHLDWLVSREIALDLFAGAAAAAVLIFVADLGKTAVWLGAFLTPILVREARHVARDWSRAKRLSSASALALVSGYKQGQLPNVVSHAATGLRHWASSQLTPAAAASVVVVVTVTATEAAVGTPSSFFGDGSPPVASSTGAWVIPAGKRATLKDVRWGAPADALTYGYQIDSDKPVVLGSKPAGGFGPRGLTGRTIEPSSSERTLRIFLSDTGDPAGSCNYTFYSDGSHARIVEVSSGSNVWFVDMRDSEFCTKGPDTALVPEDTGRGDLVLIFSIH